MTPKQAHRFIRTMTAGMNDPMTQHYSAGEFVMQAQRDKARRSGLDLDEIGALAADYIDRQHAIRTRYRDPARMEWKMRRGYERMMRRAD